MLEILTLFLPLRHCEATVFSVNKFRMDRACILVNLSLYLLVSERELMVETIALFVTLIQLHLELLAHVVDEAGLVVLDGICRA